MKDKIEKNKEGFEFFIKEIPYLLELLHDLLLNSKNYKNITIDFKLETVSKVESLYIDILKENERTILSKNLIDKIMIAYYGEAFIHNAGGNWEYNDHKDDYVYGTPIIFNWGNGKNNMRISPVSLIESIKKKLTPGMLISIDYAVNMEEREKKIMDEMRALSKKRKK